MNKSLSDLLGNVELVKESIKKHCVTVANIWPSGVTPKTAVVTISVVDSILDYIEDLVHHNDDRIVDVMDQIRTIHQNLTNLKNMEVHQEHEEFSMQLINMAYEVEYIINSFAPVWYITSRLLQVAKKIKPMRMQLQELKKNDAGMLTNAEYPRQHISFQDHIGDEYLIGLKDEEMEIKNRLYRGTRKLQVISISGIPGLGKTTFAKKLYNNPMIQQYFHRMAWCVVSQTYQWRNILIDILMSVSSYNTEKILNMKDDYLKETLYKCLKGMRYIIVMDDIWNADAWNGIKRCLPDDNCGSRILFTCQNMDVGMMASYSSSNYPLRFLTEDESWDLLQWKVFNKGSCPPELVDGGRGGARIFSQEGHNLLMLNVKFLSWM